MSERVVTNPCTGSSVKWAIPAAVLNSLWSDFFPRLVAASWKAALGGAAGTPVIAPGDDATALLKVLEQLKTDMDAVIFPATGGGAMTLSSATQPGMSVVLRKRLVRIIDFFRSYPTAKPFPFSISGLGGYDFLLSDWGVEFFMPGRPTNAADLLRYYSFRATGRPSIGLPEYLPSSGIVDSPTGPNQVAVSPARLLSLAQQGSHPDDCALKCLEERFDAHGSGMAPYVVGISGYMCLLASFRCWQMEGSVYRGIMAEVPRAIATAWMEKQDNTDAKPHAYHPRVFGAGANLDDGFRQIFRERLETWIAPADRLFFGFAAAPPFPVPVWDAKDLMITNLGFHFPDPTDHAADVGNALLTRLVSEIALGRAGNPVFTDSKRTQE